MRKQLEELSNKIEWIENNNLYQAISDLKEALQKIVELLDQALPPEIEPD